MQTQMTPYFLVSGSGDIWPFIILADDKIGFFYIFGFWPGSYYNSSLKKVVLVLLGFERGATYPHGWL